jgi:hypothetical protein
MLICKYFDFEDIHSEIMTLLRAAKGSEMQKSFAEKLKQ